MTGKPRKLIVSWRWTRLITRLLRAFSIRFSTRSRLASSILCRMTGWSAMKAKNTHQRSLRPIHPHLTLGKSAVLD